MPARRPVLLDCTLRDGGYYTNWEFGDDLVVAYLDACEAVGVDVVELGYLRSGDAGTGPFGRLPAALPPAVGRRLAASPLTFAAMVDVKELAGTDPAAACRDLRTRLTDAPVGFAVIRLAVHHSRLGQAMGLVRPLIGEGYRVCVNLMQVDMASDREIAACLEQLAVPELEAVYVADSLGSMHPERVASLVGLFREALGAAIGFHAHDNQGLALHNSLQALSAGARWIDSTMCGIGRGAGNARTEQLVPLLGREPVDAAGLDLLNRAVARHFLPIWEEHRWGASVYYAIAGARRVHPSYVQGLETLAVDPQRKIGVLSYLAEARASSYSADLLNRALDDVR